MRIRWLQGGRTLAAEMRAAGYVEDLDDATAQALLAQGHIALAPPDDPEPPAAPAAEQE